MGEGDRSDLKVDLLAINEAKRLGLVVQSSGGMP
jgi:hypothetical protein